ncbi:MAG: hypothetical protein ACP5OB_02530 [Candidatus Ratteibacteria bacterium]
MKKFLFLWTFICFSLFAEIEYISPSQVKKLDYKIELTQTGAISINFNGENFIITSEYSLIPGWAKFEKDKIEGFKNVKIEKDKVYGETDTFKIEREIKKNQESIEVIEKIKNKTNELLPIIIRHKTEIQNVKEYYLGGLRIYLKRATSSDSSNPTTIILTEKSGIGLMPIDDVFRVHIQNFAAGNTYGIADNNFVLMPDKEYTMKFAIFLSDRPDYFSVINSIRRFLDVNFTIPGSFCFFTPRTKSYFSPKDTEELKQKFNTPVLASSDMEPDLMKKYFTNKNAYFISFSFNKGATGIEAHNIAYYSENPDILPFIKDIIKRIKDVYPDGKILPYYHCFINTEKDAKEKYKDARILLPDGQQADYGNPVYPLFFPTLENSYGKLCEKQIDEYLDLFGADGIYWDEFEYSMAKYHYDKPHDGYSADIDPQIHKIIRLKSSVTLLTQPWRVKMVEKILNEKKKLLVINGNPHTETILRYKVPRFVETGSISNCTRAQLFTPIALGDHITERSEKDAYRKMLEALDYGCLYYWYFYLIWPEYPTLTTYMFPITPIEINKGYIIGKERIITKVSGYFGWGDNSNAEVHFFDSEGREIKKDTEKVKKDGKTYYKVILGDYESCVLVRKGEK